MENTLERIAEQNVSSYEAAKHIEQVGSADGKGKTDLCDKVKVIARNNGTFDVVWFKKKEEVKIEKKVEEKPEQKKVHGLKAKDRKKLVKKSK